jgi:serine/threonine-protein kinase
MIGDFGEVYLLDWGIAVSLRDDGTGRLPLAANARHLAGTPAYMAPEMLGRDESPPLSERTDVYLAGSVLYEIVTGAPPHRGSNAIAMLAHVIASEPELPPHVAPELAKLITRAMHPDPAERFESADALRRALRAYLEHRGSELVCARATERLGELRAAVAAARTGDAADEIYRLFGACRSGFHDALATSKDNELAVRGLDDALLVVAEYELERGRAQAAVARLRERSTPTPLLARAHAEVEREARRVAELERVGRQHDVAIGRRTRVLLTVVFGTLFTVIPSIIASVPSLRHASHATHIAFAAVFVVVLAGTMWFARERMFATSINRTVGAASLALFVIQGTIAAGDWLAGRPPTDAYRENLVLYAAIVAILAFAIDRYLVIGAVGYLAAFVLVSNDAALALYMASVANALFTVIAVWRWSRF